MSQDRKVKRGAGIARDKRGRLLGDPNYGPAPAGNLSGAFRLNAAAGAVEAFGKLDARERGAVIEAWWRGRSADDDAMPAA